MGEKKSKVESVSGITTDKATEQQNVDNIVHTEVTSKFEANAESTFKKDFYSNSYLSIPHDNEKEKAEADKYRKEQRITMYGKGKSDGQLHPIRNFEKLGFQDNLLGAVKNFKEPTPIQAAAWPVIAS